MEEEIGWKKLEIREDRFSGKPNSVPPKHFLHLLSGKVDSRTRTKIDFPEYEDAWEHKLMIVIPKDRIELNKGYLHSKSIYEEHFKPYKKCKMREPCKPKSHLHALSGRLKDISITKKDFIPYEDSHEYKLSQIIPRCHLHCSSDKFKGNSIYRFDYK